MENLEKKIVNYLFRTRNTKRRMKDTLLNRLAFCSILSILGCGTEATSNNPTDSKAETGIIHQDAQREPERDAELETEEYTEIGEGGIDTETPCQKKVYYQDKDGDGYGNLKESQLFCLEEIPSGYVEEKNNLWDCDDEDHTIYSGAKEICDQLDNDCDGETDEGVTNLFWKDKDGDGQGDKTQNFEGCKTPAGYVLNTLDCDDFDKLTHFNAPELCDYKDNDCDGETDEKFKSLGEICFSGEGECKTAGVLDCLTNSNGVYCTATPNEPSQELCDLLDNDCDKLIDEEDVCIPVCTPHQCIYQEGGGIKECGLIKDECEGVIDCGECKNDALNCVDNLCIPIGCKDTDEGETFYMKGTTTGANDTILGGLTSATDTCEGEILTEYLCYDSSLYNNSKDYEYPITVAYTEYKCPGVCADGACIPLICIPEICDNQDNNCDGLTDEGIISEQLCGVTNLGECNFGTEFKYCINGQYTEWSDCDAIFPQEEICDNKDNNCDGKTDEELILKQQCGITDIGECTYGVEFDFCLAGKYTGWQICDAIFPGEETCDGKDNDCNGMFDELFNVWNPCYSGVGECESKGFFQCTKTGLGTYCNAVPNEPTIEVCDNKDNDCDDSTDEDVILEQVCGFNNTGECKTSLEFKYCINGEYSEWVGCKATLPVVETCDGLDNNCNGETDEVFKTGEECYLGEGICKSQGFFECTLDGFDVYCNAVLNLPEEEVCDSLDNNCNGLTDENLVQTCYSICGEGIEVCTTGAWTGCTAPLPGLEICDYLDNDCNGLIDENFGIGEVCYLGEGGCKSQGSIECTADGFDEYCTAVPKEPKLELCDALDNDCNGMTDENLSQPCNTACGSGLETCVIGNWKNCTAPQPQPEVCDGKDNDCNGKIDELIECCPLAGHWSFDEGAGNIANDSSGKGNHGTISGASWVEGIVGNAMSFDGKDDHIKISDAPSLNPENITVTGWIKLSDWDFGGKTSSGQVGFLVGKTYQYGFGIGTYFDKKIAFQVCSGLAGSTLKCPTIESEVLDLNKWIFVVGTYDGKKTKLYVDGNLTSSIDFLGSIPYYTGPLGIGLDFRLEGPPNLVDNFFFKGIVDDMRIYSCALSPEQIAEEYQQVYMNSTKK